MPTYEYDCLKCGHGFEVFQSMKDASLTVCTCGKKGKVRRKIGGGAGLIFKGSGFYETDYKRNSSTTKEGGEKSKTNTTPSPSKTESKPASTSSAKMS